MHAWENFFFAEVGASAALAGLIFVSVSINLHRILSMPALPSRASQALCMLVAVLVVSSLMLVPDQSSDLIGGELLVVGLAIWLAITLLDVRIWRITPLEYRRPLAMMTLMNQIALLPYIVAGAAVLSWGLSGLYWLVAATILSFIKALLDAWVLLIEINR